MKLVDFFKSIFSGRKDANIEEIIELPDKNDLEEFKEKVEEIEIFDSKNVISNKLGYLEQYIKIFSLSFPKKYKEYSSMISNLKKDYSKELKNFESGKEGNITFSIDPEHESKRYMEVVSLEDDIKRFVEFEVDYKVYLDKFAKLCYKLNLFYNSIIDTTLQKDRIINQIINAYNSLEQLVKETSQREFFNKDSRKKDDILNYIIYSDYIIFKTFLRLGRISDFEEYKQEMSKIYSFFVSDQYDNFVFKFFIESLEEIQLFISSELSMDSMFEYVLLQSQTLERKLDNYDESFNNYEFFQSVIKLENTVYSLVNSHNLKFVFDVSKMINFQQSSKDIISINKIANSILSIVNNDKAKLLVRIINRFKVQISWREFYFLCKIFELTKDIVKISENTIFNVVKEKFTKLSERYPEYTDSYICTEKRNILNYTGNKVKKYIVLLKISEDEVVDLIELLNLLKLDFAIQEGTVYLNYSYFNGFKNLEKNFGKVITL